MTITTLLDPTKLPFRTMDQTVFDQAQAYLMTNLPTWGAEVNATQVNLNAVAVGGGYAIPYTFSTLTADADPGPGILRLDNATQNAAAVIRADILGANNKDYTTIIDTFDDSTSAVKGTIRIFKQGDASTFLTFNVTGMIGTGGYRNITVAGIGGSAASPFANGDPLWLHFQRTGDKGDTVVALLGSATVSSPAANIDFLTVFSSTYDKYVIEVSGVTMSANDIPALRLAKVGAADATSGAYLTAQGNAAASATSSQIALTAATNNAASGGISLTIEVRNANDTAGMKGIGVRGMYYTTTPAATAISTEGGYTGANVVTGFRLFLQGGANFTGGKVRVYGFKNT
jgi:hypothetical protein